MPAKTRRPGRPTEIRDRQELVVYLTRRERGRIRDAASGAGLSMSAWARRAVLRALTTRQED